MYLLVEWHDSRANPNRHETVKFDNVRVFVFKYEQWWLGPVRHTCVQRSFDELGTPLRDVTFCVLDLETTGGHRTDDQITEVGAVKVRGGDFLGTFQTLVNPGRAIPPQITLLTGLSDALVGPAPRIGAVLPSLLEFVGDSVIVGHNIGFDLAFLRHAFERTGRTPMRQPEHRHGRPRPPARARRGARLPARHARVAVPARPPAEPPGARRCARHDRSAPPPHRAGVRPRRARPRRPVRARQAGRSPAGGQAEDDGQPAALPRRLHVLRAPRRGALRRQGDQPAPARAQLLRQRRPPQDRPDAARDPVGPPPRPARPAHRRGGREPPHRLDPPPLQPCRNSAWRSTATSGSTSTRRGPACRS